MNPFAASIWWWVVLGVLGAEAAVAVALPILGQRRIHSAAGRRVLWQLTVLALLAIPLAEFGGVGREAAHWLKSRIEARRLPPSEVRPVPAVHRPVDVVPLTAAPRTRDLVEPERPLPLIPPPKIEPPGHLACHWPAWVWLAGCGLVVGRLAVQHGVFLVHRRRYHQPAENALEERVSLLARKLGIARRVRVVESEKLSSPIAFGLFRPGIGLPAGFTAHFTPAQQDAMLAHELAHLAARDAVWHLLADLAAAVWWWHPMAWWARRQLQSASEVAADEASLVVRNGPASLAESLVKLGAQMTEPQSPGGLGIEGKGFRSGLGRRVERLLQLDGQEWQAPSRLKSFLAHTIGPAALALVAVLCGAWAWPQSMLDDETLFSRWRQSWRGVLAPEGPVPSLETLALKPQFQARKVEMSTSVQDAKLLDEMRLFGQAEEKLKEVIIQDPANQIANYLMKLIREAQYGDAARNRAPLLYPTLPPKLVTDPQSNFKKDGTNRSVPLPPLLYPTKPLRRVPGADAAAGAAQPPDVVVSPASSSAPSIVIASGSQQTGTNAGRTNEVEKRWLLPGERDTHPIRNPYIRTNVPNTSTKMRQALLAKMEKVTISELHFDAQPLSEVVKLLTDECKRQDPQKKGVNFILNPFLESAPPVPRAAPGTNSPPPPQRIDLENVIINIKPSIMDIPLRYALDAICKMASQPIQFIVEDYAVVFLPGSADRFPRSYKTDPNTFKQGLEGVRPAPLPGPGNNNPRQP